jgi:hypothetical protein
MQVPDVVLTGDVLRISGVGRDESVEALAEVPDRDRARSRGTAYREVEIDQRMTGIGRREEQLPPRSRLPCEQGV